MRAWENGKDIGLDVKILRGISLENNSIYRCPLGTHEGKDILLSLSLTVECTPIRFPNRNGSVMFIQKAGAGGEIQIILYFSLSCYFVDYRNKVAKTSMICINESLGICPLL